MMYRDEKNTKFEALMLYFQEVLRKHTVIISTVALTHELLK
jgi:hypothetical protein